MGVPVPDRPAEGIWALPAHSQNTAYGLACRSARNGGLMRYPMIVESILLSLAIPPMALAQSGPPLFPAQRCAVGENPVSVVMADLNGDGRRDLVTADAGSDDVSVLLDLGGGTFGAAGRFAAGSHPSAVRIADFNADGRPDLAVVDTWSDDISILLGDGQGGFGAAAQFNVGPEPTSIDVGDLNGDGHPDLAVANRGSGNVSVLATARSG